MLSDLVARLRPTGTTSADITAAMARARAAQAEADAAVAKAQGEWEAALLDADLKGLAEVERKLNEAKTVAAATAARVNAVLGQLEQRHAAAKRAEVLGREEAARKAAEDAGRALAAWWTKAQPKLHAILQEGAKLDDAYGAAQYAQQDADRAVRAAYPGMPQQHPVPTGNDAADWKDSLPSMTELPRPPQPGPTAAELEEQAARAERQAQASEEYRERNRHNVTHHRGGTTIIGNRFAGE